MKSISNWFKISGTDEHAKIPWINGFVAIVHMQILENLFYLAEVKYYKVEMNWRKWIISNDSL